MSFSRGSTFVVDSEFAASNPVEGFDAGTLEMSFQELRQVREILLNQNKKHIKSRNLYAVMTIRSVKVLLVCNTDFFWKIG